MRNGMDVWRTGRIFQGGATSPFSFFSSAVLTLHKTASCSSPALHNTSQLSSFGISLFLSLKTILDPDTFESGDVG